MRKKEETRNKEDESSQLEKALTVLIGSTRRTKREKDLLKIASALKIAEKIIGRKAVARILDISPEMLREFASVEKLHPCIKDMIRKNLVSSVDVAYRLSMLPEPEQLAVAKAYVNNEIKGKDVKDVVQFRNRNPYKTINQAIERIKETRDIIQYVIKFRIPEKDLGRITVKQRFETLCGKENIISVEIKGSIVTLIISEEGQRNLQNKAREKGLTKRRLIQNIF